MQDQAALLNRLTRVVARTPPESPLALRLCVALTEILEMSGAAMSVGFSATNRTVLCTTSPLAERIEDLQDVLREGPGLEADRLRGPVWATLAEARQRWPLLVQAIDHDELSGFVALPMQPGPEILGVITLYHRDERSPAYSEGEAQFLANAIGIAVVGGFNRNQEPEKLWTLRDRVSQATGMVVAQLRIRPADALAVLRAHAFASDVSVAEIAGDVLERRLDFRTTDQPGRSGPDREQE